MKKRTALYKVAFVVVTFFSGIVVSRAQYATGDMFIQDITGKPIPLHTGFEIIGDVNYPEKYKLAKLYSGSGKVIASNVSVRINLEDYAVLYRNAKNEEMEAITPISMIEFIEPIDNNSSESKVVFRLLNSVDDPKFTTKFYQVLTDGDVQLLKLYTLDYTDTKDYGSATVRRTYDRQINYYTYSKEKGVAKISKADDLVRAASADKASKVSAYLSKNRVSVRKESDLVNFYKFYGTL